MRQNASQHLPRISVGDAARLFGLSARAVRFYEIEGLIEATRDRRNNRVFDATARQRLRWIALLRGAGVSLVDVRRVLDEDDEGHRSALMARTLAGRKAMVEAQLEKIDAALRAIASVSEASARPRTTGAPAHYEAPVESHRSRADEASYGVADRADCEALSSS